MSTIIYSNVCLIRFETSAEARTRAAAEGNSRAEDVIPIYRRKTQVDPSGKETEIRQRYFIVDGVDALKKFGEDPWYVSI